MATRTARSAAPLEAFVLHRYDWSESSLILDLFTREQGRLAVAAKGAKRPTSQLRSVLLPFQRVNITLGRVPASESEMPEVQTLRGAEWAGGAPMLRGAAMFSGFYLNELLMKLLARHDPHAGVFDAYAATLPALSGDELQSQSALRAFELVLMRETGVLPELGLVTQTQEPLREDARYALLAEVGVVLAPDPEQAFDGATLVRLQAALEHGSIEALQQACSAALPALRPTLRAYLHYHLGSASLRTRQVMREVQQLID